MNLIVAGGTGFIGKALCDALLAERHAVTVLTRSIEERRRDAVSSNAVSWNGRTVGAWQALIDGCDAVINLAGENIAEGRWSEARKKRLVDSRLESTRALVTAIQNSARKPKLLLNASAIGIYGDRGEEPVDEGSAPGSDFLARLCADWESEARRAESAGCRVALLRTGIVLGPGGGALAKMLPPFKLGLGGPLGSGRQWMSWISLDDEVGLIIHALQGSLSGPINLVAPAPARNADFAKALGRALHRPAVLPAPAFALKLALGEMSELLLGGQKVVPKKALESGYRFQHPTLESALKASLG